MSSQRYERISAHDEDDSPTSPQPLDQSHPIPASPPPSFRSRASSTEGRHLLSTHDSLTTEAERTLADTFDSPSDDDASDDEDGDGSDDRQRLMRGNPTDNTHNENTSAVYSDAGIPRVERRMTQLPVFAPREPGRVYGAGNANDGVFANLSAKPTRGEEADEKPPTYEQAAADATPPYWETTILAPGTYSDEVFVDGLPVGSVFSFAWNAMISMSFQIVGFLLTYLLHTTHAAKHGSRAGLGITLVQYGFSFKGNTLGRDPTPTPGGDDFGGAPTDPNSHDFDPSGVVPDPSIPGSDAVGGLTTSDWIAYALMIIGWFILIRSVSDFLRARRHEQLVLQSPERGLGTAVVAEGEQPESSV